MENNGSFTPSGLEAHIPCLVDMKNIFKFNDVNQQVLTKSRVALDSYIEAVIQTYTRIRKPYTKRKFTRHKIRLVSQQGPPVSFYKEYWVERKGVKLGQLFTIQITSASWPNPEGSPK